MSFSDYLEDVVLDDLLIDGLYFGVSTADPGDDAATLAEPSGNSYARVTFDEADWNAASGGSKTNLSAVTFPEASGSWGTISYLCLFDAETEGNLLMSGALTASKSITTGQTLTFPASSVTITLG